MVNNANYGWLGCEKSLPLSFQFSNNTAVNVAKPSNKLSVWHLTINKLY